MKPAWSLFCLVSLPVAASAQQSMDFITDPPAAFGAGWRGFLDFAFLLNALLTLTLATVLGAIIAYHPRHEQTADTLDEIEAPKVYIMYAVIGAIIGIMVVKYGLVVGFVLFGIGGLIRFRTVLRSARLTGQVILVTLIGLSCGLDLPHVAVLATVFGFGLIYVLEARATYRLDVRALPSERVVEAAAAYRSLLEQEGCRILGEKKNPVKSHVSFIFQTERQVSRAHLDEVLDSRIDASIKGSVDWEVD